MERFPTGLSDSMMSRLTLARDMTIQDYRLTLLRREAGLARDQFGRDVQVWTYAPCVQRETQQAAEEYLQHLEMLSNAGLDGILLTWVDFIDAIDRFTDGVMPVLEARGLREPHRSIGA